MTKVITILICSVLIIQSLVLTPFLTAVKFGLKEKMESYIRNCSSERFETLSFSANEYAALKWVSGDEFVWNGILYDAIHVNKSAGSYQLTVIADKNEKSLVDSIELNHSQNDHKAEKTISLLMFSIVFYSEFDHHRITSSSVEIEKKDFLYNKSYSSFQKELSSPPPKTA